MVNRPKQIGTRAETAVVKACHRAGLTAHRVALAGIHDQGDIHILDGRITCEVKAGDQTRSPSWGQLQAWWAETLREAARVPTCEVAVLVTRRWGSGQAEGWVAHLDTGDLAALLGGQAPSLEEPVAIRLGALLRLISERVE